MDDGMELASSGYTGSVTIGKVGSSMGTYLENGCGNPWGWVSTQVADQAWKLIHEWAMWP